MKILYLPNCWSQQRQHEKKRWIYPVLLAMQAEYYRQSGHEVYWETCPKHTQVDKIVGEPENIPFLSLPWPDRRFTNAFDKKYQDNGNFKYKPATYIQAANGCWHGRCTFCTERNNKWELRDPFDVACEIDQCSLMGFREVFDDSGTFPVGKWLDTFISGLNYYAVTGIKIGCNMRMIDAPYEEMKQAGFRMLLFGLESANQNTLDRIQKGTKVEDIKYIIKAAEAGLECHVAVMFGYPWENEKDSMETLKLVHYLLRRGYAKTAQASFYRNVCDGSNEATRKFVRQIYGVCRYPDFWFNQIKDTRNVDDLKYLWRKIKEGLRK